MTLPAWWTLARCLSATAPDTFHDLNAALERAWASGATPFEVIAGTPFARYGARVTFEHADPADLARAFGVNDHPWGTPSWIGIRVTPARGLRVKAYHAADRLDDRFDLPSEWPDDLYPVMAALDGHTVEVYLKKKHACGFAAFAARCLEPLGLDPPELTPAPMPHDDAFGVSVRREAGRITAISLYAYWRALPHDRDIERLWSASLPEPDRFAYELAVAGVQSLGWRRTGNWHTMVAWTAEATGERHRAVSLGTPSRRSMLSNG